MLCQEAALAAMSRASGNGAGDKAASAVTHEDLEGALARLRAGSLAQTSGS